MTKIVTSKNYRAPELVLQFKDNYTNTVDMWSLGCIIAELFNKKVFFAVSTTQDYLDFLIALLGLPEPEIEAQITKTTYLNFMKERSTQITRKSLKQLVPEATPEAIDLM